jgi:16S rRNA (adenine1518-N6/adenine1519-N6)-dimethyltransferase
VSNLPYQAGTRILLEFVQRRLPPSMTVLVQTEVAERLAAKEGGKTRGLAGVWTQLDYDVRIVRRVSASCFWPRPEVGSTVVRLDRHDRNAGMSAEERKTFHRITKLAFEHRRKQLGSIFKDMVQSTARAEELANEDWIALTKGLIGNEDTRRVS